jgi:predicted nucleic acid-binding protein
MPEAISNASPLIQLSKIEKLPLLAQLHWRVMIPNAVYREVVLAGKERPGAEAVAGAVEEGWILRTAAREDQVLQLLREQIDEGESEAIRLAMDNPSSVVLLDDVAARSVAIRLGLRVTGTVGLLLRAKQDGLIPLIQPLIEQLRVDGRFYIAPAIMLQILEAAGE